VHLWSYLPSQMLCIMF